MTVKDFEGMPSSWLIRGVGSEVIGRWADEKAYLKLMTDKGKVADGKLVLNTTNLRTLARAFGDDMSRWVGQTIHIRCRNESVLLEARPWLPRE